ncbi:hypothetical protein OIE13_13975 [Streptosporangium sp. NBC_01810]|nr:hypothetical protein [Streptosporangium sp. NBC_01810]WSA29816.1 hypothetical protein OIE13_13975 [Streptosporangium sp. NBC_01810]
MAANTEAGGWPSMPIQRRPFHLASRPELSVAGTGPQATSPAAEQE